MENYEMEQVAPEEPGDITDKVSQELEVKLPGRSLPPGVRLIAFFTLIGGLSIIGSLFVDIVRPSGVDIFLHILRILVGVLAITISYGIIERRMWSLWLYGLLGLVSLATNPVLAIVPIGVLVYLYTKRTIFTPFILDVLIAQGSSVVMEKIRSLFPPNKPTSLF